MSTLSTLALGLAAACALPVFSVSAAWADGCYTCGGGSSDACKDYCRYSGQDTFAARKTCESKGCKVSGTASCPTAANYKVCLAPAPAQPVLAAIPWCAAPPRS
jgi:hypothetical protein